MKQDKIILTFVPHFKRLLAQLVVFNFVKLLIQTRNSAVRPFFPGRQTVFQDCVSVLETFSWFFNHSLSTISLTVQCFPR